jgi:hypothetical protein
MWYKAIKSLIALQNRLLTIFKVYKLQTAYYKSFRYDFITEIYSDDKKRFLNFGGYVTIDIIKKSL